MWSCRSLAPPADFIDPASRYWMIPTARISAFSLDPPPGMLARALGGGSRSARSARRKATEGTQRSQSDLTS